MPGAGPTYRFRSYADRFQFCVLDAGAAVDDLVDGGSWSDEASGRTRIVVARWEVAVGTARRDVVPVTLEVRAGPLALGSLDAYDHVVEADLELPCGRLAVTRRHRVAQRGRPGGAAAWPLALFSARGVR